MHRKRTIRAAVLGVCVAGVVASLLANSAFGRVQAPKAPKATSTVINVLAGKPSELSFLLSKASMIPAGTVTFNIQNAGLAFHDFKICLRPITASGVPSPNTCAGKVTKVLHHGDTASLTVTLSKTGLYEFLCSVTGHAAAGMKGLIGIGVAVPKAAVHVGKVSLTATTTTTGTTTTSGGGGTTTTGTTTTTGGGGGGQGPDGCPAGQTIQSVGADDHDDDDSGAPSDGDGCI
jgi:uncharacterized cupredoxin-like copper-binding protein